MNLIATLSADLAHWQALRRDLHAHPELGFDQQRSSARVAERLAGMGLEVLRGLGRTGVVGVLRGVQADGPRIGLRADLDALPITERNTFAHASTSPGRMHACGHDGHTTMLLAAAAHLSRQRPARGVVYFIFQPAEEGGGGAREMIADGLFTRCPMDAVFALHNWPGLPAGSLALSPGPVMASSNEWAITLQGRGGHAAMPHLSADPVPAAAQLVLALQTVVSRSLKPTDAAVLSVTQLQAGETTNVIPDSCTLQGTVRTFSLPVLDQVEQRLRALSAGVAAAWGLRAEVDFVRNYPPTLNHPAPSAFARAVATDLLGAAQVLAQEPSMGAEDFAYMLQACPGAYAFLGNGDGGHRDLGHGGGPCTLHNASYDFNDAIIPTGAAYWVRLAQAWLNQPA